jgi:ABC-type multidrug transport system fused ATPase/permease subunit
MIKHYLQLWSHLAPLHRAGAIALAIGNVIASILEVTGIALFGAVMWRLTQHGTSAPGPGLAPLLGPLAAASLATLTVVCGLAYAGKNALMFAMTWVEARLALGVQTHLSVRALAAVLGQDYEVASRRDQSGKINLMTAGMHALAFSVLLPGLMLLAEATLMVTLVLFLVLTQPLFVAGMLAVLCAVAGALVLVSRRLVLLLGGSRHRFEDDRLRLLGGVFSHLREVYIYSAGSRAVAHLNSVLGQLAAAHRGFHLVQNAPRFVLEVALIGVLLTVIFWHARSGLDPTLVVSIGVFGVAGFRLLLGINRVVGSVQAMRFAGSMIERILDALDSPPGPAPRGRGRSGTPDGALRLSGVTYAYNPGVPVLRGVDFVLPRRCLVAINGRSGAGKSTLLEIMAGLRAPIEGEVELDGQRIAHKQALLGRIAYAGQQPAVLPDTVRANVAFGLPPEAIDDQAVWDALARAHVDDVVLALPGQLDFRLGPEHALSGGQMQRLALARALYMDCDYLLLDEPTASLDPQTEQQLLATFRELAKTTGVVVVSHRPAPLEAADVVWELSDGRLIPAASAPG